VQESSLLLCWQVMLCSRSRSVAKAVAKPAAAFGATAAAAVGAVVVAVLSPPLNNSATLNSRLVTLGSPMEHIRKDSSKCVTEMGPGVIGTMPMLL
jgi:hypothetical protein